MISNLYNCCFSLGPVCWSENLFLRILLFPWRCSLPDWRCGQQDDLGRENSPKEYLVDSHESHDKEQGYKWIIVDNYYCKNIDFEIAGFFNFRDLSFQSERL